MQFLLNVNTANSLMHLTNNRHDNHVCSCLLWASSPVVVMYLRSTLIIRKVEAKKETFVPRYYSPSVSPARYLDLNNGFS